MGKLGNWGQPLMKLAASPINHENVFNVMYAVFEVTRP